MINIITGPVDSGKTAYLAAAHEALGTGDGYILNKFYIAGHSYGQTISRLQTGESRLFSLRAGAVGGNGGRGAFIFSPAGFEFAENIIAKAIAAQTSPVFADEIGPLELSGRGFCGSLKKLIGSAHETGADIFLAIRETCLREAVEMFGIYLYEHKITQLSQPQALRL